MAEPYTTIGINILSRIEDLMPVIPLFAKYSGMLEQNGIMKIADIVRLTEEDFMLVTDCSRQEAERLRASLIRNQMDFAMPLGQVTHLYEKVQLQRDMSEELISSRMETLAHAGIQNAGRVVIHELVDNEFPLPFEYVDHLMAKIQTFIDNELNMRAYWQERMLDIRKSE